MDVTKPYKFIGFGALDVTKPYKFIRFGALDVTKPYTFIGLGAMDLAVLGAKIKIRNPRIRAGIGPKPTIS